MTLVRRVARDRAWAHSWRNPAPMIILIAKSDRSGAVSMWRSRGLRCRVGVGGTCESPSEFARCLREAQVALRLHDAISGEQAVVYDVLGICCILAGVEEIGTIEQFL